MPLSQIKALILLCSLRSGITPSPCKLSGGSMRLLVSRMVKRNDAGCSWRVRKLSLLLLKRCAGGALARCVLRQYALRAQAQAVWQDAPGEITVNVAERSYDD